MTRTTAENARLWLRVCNEHMDLAAVLNQLTDEELRTWLEVAQNLDIPRERKVRVAKAYNQR